MVVQMAWKSVLGSAGVKGGCSVGYSVVCSADSEVVLLVRMKVASKDGCLAV